MSGAAAGRAAPGWRVSPRHSPTLEGAPASHTLTIGSSQQGGSHGDVHGGDESSSSHDSWVPSGIWVVPLEAHKESHSPCARGAHRGQQLSTVPWNSQLRSTKTAPPLAFPMSHSVLLRGHSLALRKGLLEPEAALGTWRWTWASWRAMPTVFPPDSPPVESLMVLYHLLLQEGARDLTSLLVTLFPT